MYLKSLNTRYEMAVMGVSLLLTAVILLSLTFWSAAAAPLFVNEQKLIASDGGFGDDFGHSVAVSGSAVVVGARADTIGANLNQGSAYVFNRQGGGRLEAQKLTASNGAAGDQFGWSAAVSGSTIVVGAWLDDIGGNVDQGSAYVFSLQGGTWVETQQLIASDGAARDHFGWSVAVSGSTIVVGAIGDDTFQGSAYVFNRQGRSWVQTQKLTASDEATSEFGYSVAISGSTLLVGAVSDSSGGNFFQGSAYVFNRQGRSWVEEQKLTASDGAESDLFGWSVAIGGSTLVVSARGDTIGANFDQGSAYVFNRHGGEWVEEQKLTASDGATFDEFGSSVALSGSTVVVGAVGDDIGGNSAQGSAYVFNRRGGEWVEEQKLTASDGGTLDFFGNSVALSGTTVVVGAVGADIGGNFFLGSAYVFEL